MKSPKTTVATFVALSTVCCFETQALVAPQTSKFAPSWQLNVATAATPEAASSMQGGDKDDSATSFVSSIATGAAASEKDASIDDNDDLEAVEFPPPLSALDRAKRAVTFWSTAIPIVANYYGLIGNIKLQELLGAEVTEEDVEVGVEMS
jgi:hypothetical protein